MGGAGVYYVVNLEQVPSTGRWRFNDISIADEKEMGDQAFQQTLAQFRGRLLPESHPASVQVRRVVSRIVNAAAQLDAERAPGAEPTQWSVYVVHDNQMNAFVLPGGKIFVFTGILPVCGGDAGLATVLSHEVAHQLARHSAEKMAGYKVLLLGSFVLNLLGMDFGLSRIALNLLLSCV
ncbi:metalloendopeptidase [Malassezia cuniculi]|uniref:Metalloendopeptidase n=1 Tax=Malassezia cuniculi TaxID=948313 RepID=A0AAF0ETZ1_9BASI|nr:metalloendopeptidase [Malassezia cuniculi]